MISERNRLQRDRFDQVESACVSLDFGLQQGERLLRKDSARVIV